MAGFGMAGRSRIAVLTGGQCHKADRCDSQLRSMNELQVSGKRSGNSNSGNVGVDRLDFK